MGEVFLADQLGPLGPVRPVALKRLLPQFARDENALALFLAEMATAARLAHPNIAITYDFGQVDGVYFLAMEYIEGLTLRSVLDQVGALDVAEALLIAAQVAEALAYAHGLRSAGGAATPLVHSDVCPENIMLSSRGTVKLLDFGIARAEAAVLSGRARGKIRYASPAQIRGAAPDRRFDLWALGAVLYEALTGRPPFLADDVEQLLAEAETGSFTPLEDARPEAAPFAPMIRAALSPNPEHASADARAFAGACLASHPTLEVNSDERIAALVLRSGGHRVHATDLDESTATGIIAIAPRAAAFERPPSTQPATPLPAARQIAPAEPESPPFHERQRSKSRMLFGIVLSAAGGASAALLLRLALTEPPPAPRPPPQVASSLPAPVPTDPHPVVEVRSASTSAAPTHPAALKHHRNIQSPRPSNDRGLGVLAVRSVPWAHVWLDGQVLGDGVIAARPISSGKHELILRPGDTGLSERRLTLDVRAGVVTKVLVDLRTGKFQVDAGDASAKSAP